MEQETRWGRRRHRESEALQLLRAELERTRQDLARAYGGFNAVWDPDLVESFCYEINALRARHTYLLRQVKALERGPERESA